MAENTIIHEISLAGYKATSTGGMLDLGTWGSYGIEKLHLTLDAAWQDLTITAFFNVKGEVVGKALVGKDGYADVPWEATKENTFAGRIVFEGSMNNQRRISANLNFKVTNHSEFEDSDPVPTDDRWNQFVTQNKEYRDGAYEAAERANARAEDAEVASEGAQAAARAAKASENAAAASASNAAADAAKAGQYAKAAQAAQEAAENAAAAAAASESAADTLAAKAERAAQEAENSNTAANNAAYLAGENATAAQQAAENAAAAANYAGQSASDAAASKAAAETAAQAAQEAQAAAAAARDDAVKAQTAAQTAAKTAQDAQNAAEKARDDAQTAQQGAEAARDAAAGSAEAAAKSEENAKQSANTLAESVENVVANTAAVAELKQQVANITPDDSTIGDKPWSSKHIIDMLFPPLEESGNPVVCYPVAGYPLGVKASWEPVQEGTGTPYPAGGGKNLFNPAWMPEKAMSYGVTWTITPDGIVTANGTASGSTYYNSDNFLLPAGTYTISEMSHFRITIHNKDADGATIATQAVGRPHTFTVENDIQNATLFFAASGTLDNVSAKPQIEKGATATAYSPYANIRPIKGRDSVTITRQEDNQVITLNMPETVYSGEVDAVTGDGKETRKTLTLDGTTNKFTQHDRYWNLPQNSAPGIADSYDTTCSHFPANTFGGNSRGKYLYTTTQLMSKYFPDANALNAYLVAQYVAGSPVQVYYNLTEPVPFTATGAQPIPALAGANTVLTDADSVTVTGRADPIKRIEDLEAAVASIN